MKALSIKEWPRILRLIVLVQCENIKKKRQRTQRETKSYGGKERRMKEKQGNSKRQKDKKKLKKQTQRQKQAKTEKDTGWKERWKEEKKEERKEGCQGERKIQRDGGADT